MEVPLLSNTECNSLFKLAALEDRVEEDIWVCAGYREGGKVVVTMALMYNDHPCGMQGRLRGRLWGTTGCGGGEGQ